MLGFMTLVLLVIAAGALLILWDTHRTEAVPAASPQYIYDHATDSYVRIPWS